MSCRSTSGGRAASACATLLVPGSSNRIPDVLHALKASLAERAGDDSPLSVDEVCLALERMTTRIRFAEPASVRRRERVIAQLEAALSAYRSGQEDLPDRSTLRAWEELPAALEAETLFRDGVGGRGDFTSSPEFVPSVDRVKPYHKSFSNLKPEILALADDLFKARPSRLNEDEAKRLFEKWMSQASAMYGVESPKFTWDPMATFAGGGEYRPDTKTMAMSKVSVTTFLHEFRHHLQFEGAPMIDPDIEEDARAWSLSLYYAVRPNLLKKMVQQGRIFHIDHADFD